MRSPFSWERVLLSFLLCLCTLWPSSLPALAVGPTLIGEVQWSGSSRSTADEWLELWNLGADPVSLEGWRLIGASTNPISFTHDQFIEPYSVFLIANYSNDSDKTALTYPIDLTTSTIALSNDHLQLQLFDQFGTLQDSAGDGSKPPAGMSSPTNTSMIRVLTSTASTWEAATTSFNASTADLGTPGVCDGCKSVSASAIVPDIPPDTVAVIPPLIDPVSLQTSATNTTPLIDETTSDEGVAIESSSTTDAIATSTTPTSETQTESLNQVTSTLETTPNLDQSPIPDPVTPIALETVETPEIPTPLPDLVITEFMAAPSSGSEEWIELALSPNISLSRYSDWKIYQDGKVIFAFTNMALREMNLNNDYLLPSWKTSKLKNAGGVLQLRRADETLVQEITYGKSVHNASWIKNPTTDSWMMTLTPTKGLLNVFTPLVTVNPITTTVASPAITIVAVPGESTTSTPPLLKAPVTKELQKVKTAIAPTSSPAQAVDPVIPLPVKNLSLKTAVTSSSSKKTTKKTTSSPKKTSTKKLVATPLLMSIDALSSEEIQPKVRVRLRGIVGSAPGVFGKQQFILLGHDGRGLLVKGTAHQPSPTLGASVELTGLLSANDDGIQLKMATTDSWHAYSSPLSASTHVVDWNAPGIEDQWSLTRIEGLATDVRAQSVALETEMGSVVIPIKSAIGYRAGRVELGDKIEVTGIFDGRNGIWKVQPGKASDIVIVEVAEQTLKAAATTNSPKSSRQPWGSIGIGLGSIGAIEGIRRWLAKRRAASSSTKTLKPSTI